MTVLSGEIFSGKTQKRDVYCSWSKDLYKSQEGPLPHTNPLQILKGSRLFLGCSKLKLPPQFFYKHVWRLARPLHDIFFFLSHFFIALDKYFGLSSSWKTHPWPIFSRFSSKNLQYMAQSISPSMCRSHLVILADKHPNSPKASTHLVLDGGNVFWGIVLFSNPQT